MCNSYLTFFLLWMKKIHVLPLTLKGVCFQIYQYYPELMSLFSTLIICVSRSTIQRERYSTSSMVMIPVNPAGWGIFAVRDTVGSRTWWLYSTGRCKSYMLFVFIFHSVDSKHTMNSYLYCCMFILSNLKQRQVF